MTGLWKPQSLCLLIIITGYVQRKVFDKKSNNMNNAVLFSSFHFLSEKDHKNNIYLHGQDNAWNFYTLSVSYIVFRTLFVYL